MRPTKAPRPQSIHITLRPAQPTPPTDQIPDPEWGVYYQDTGGNIHHVDGIEGPKPRRRRR